MGKFKVGDYVVCVDPVDDLIKGATYVVREYSLDEGLIGVNYLDGSYVMDSASSMFFKRRFVLLSEYVTVKEQEKQQLEYNPRDVAFHKNTARWWLEKAIDVQKDRASEYDKEEERSASNVAKIFNILRDKDLTEADVFLILQILKQVRYCQNFDNPHQDSLLDNVSYASLFAEAAMRSKHTV